MVLNHQVQYNIITSYKGKKENIQDINLGLSKDRNGINHIKLSGTSISSIKCTL